MEPQTSSSGPAAPAHTSSTGDQAVVVSAPVGGLIAHAPDSGFVGEFDEKDIRVPQFRIVNGSGKMSQKYNQGAVVFADEVLFKTPDLTEGAKNPTLRFIPVTIQKQLRENLSQEEIAQEIMPRTVNTVAEALRLGGSTKWGPNGERPRWSPSGRCVLLLEQPEGSKHSAFQGFTLDGKEYAPAVYYCGGMAYNAFVQTIHSRLALSNAPVHRYVWQLQIVRGKGTQFAVWVPQLQMLRENPGPDALAMVARLRGSPVREEADPTAE
jgi:hypothetical protein